MQDWPNRPNASASHRPKLHRTGMQAPHKRLFRLLPPRTLALARKLARLTRQLQHPTLHRLSHVPHALITCAQRVTQQPEHVATLLEQARLVDGGDRQLCRVVVVTWVELHAQAERVHRGRRVRGSRGGTCGTEGGEEEGERVECVDDVPGQREGVQATGEEGGVRAVVQERGSDRGASVARDVDQPCLEEGRDGEEVKN